MAGAGSACARSRHRTGARAVRCVDRRGGDVGTADRRGPGSTVGLGRAIHAAPRLARARAVMAELAEEHRMPVENLLTPELLRRLAWSPPGSDAESVSTYLRSGGARDWQVQLT